MERHTDATKLPTPLARRLWTALQVRGVNGHALEKVKALPIGYASLILNGKRRQIRTKMAQAIAAALNVSSLWLEAGEGPMFLEGQENERPALPRPQRARGPRVIAIEDDPYENRRAFRHSRDFREAPGEVQEWLMSIHRDGGDASMMGWAEALEMGKRLHAAGMLKTRGVKERPVVTRAGDDDAEDSQPSSRGEEEDAHGA